MKKSVIVYYSATGNTQTLAEAIHNAVLDANDVSDIYAVGEIAADSVRDADVYFLGSPAMGVEEIEEYEFRPFFDELKDSLLGKHVFLFGSYDWGDKEWMEAWSQEVLEAGGILEGTFTSNLEPEPEQLGEMMQEVTTFMKQFT